MRERERERERGSERERETDRERVGGKTCVIASVAEREAGTRTFLLEDRPLMTCLFVLIHSQNTSLLFIHKSRDRRLFCFCSRIASVILFYMYSQKKKIALVYCVCVCVCERERDR
jgi:hypothetical protein